MANQRKDGTKLAGAYIPDEQHEILEKLAAMQGFKNKADYLRHLYEQEIEAKKHLLAKKSAKKK